MTRRLGQLCMWGSAILCIASVVLWVDSYRESIFVVPTIEQSPFSGLFFATQDGRTFFAVIDPNEIAITELLELDFRIEQGEGEPDFTEMIDYEAGDSDTMWLSTPMGIEVGTFTMMRQNIYGVVIPYWLWVCIFLTTVLVFTIRQLRKSTARETNCCVKCNYNLTGNTTGKCPECGAAIAESQKAT